MTRLFETAHITKMRVGGLTCVHIQTWTVSTIGRGYIYDNHILTLVLRNSGGKYKRDYNDGVYWSEWKGSTYSLKYVEIKIRPRWVCSCLR